MSERNPGSNEDQMKQRDIEARRACLQLHTGSCAGCQVLDIARNFYRYKSYTFEEAIRITEQEYCAPGTHIQRQHVPNTQAMYTFASDHRGENIDFDPNDRQSGFRRRKRSR